MARKPLLKAFAGITGLATTLLVNALSYAPAVAQQITGEVGSPSATMTLDGRQLPPPTLPFGGVVKEAATDSTPWWSPRVVPPKGAPNILLIMTDDQGYGVSSTFGGVIPTPSLDRIAQAGLRYTQFHSTALCSPTRAALITGRNHHSVGTGVIGELSTGFTGYNTIIPREAASIGQILRENGYATSWFGKNHNTPVFEDSVAGPFEQWPSGLGFEYFYGFMGGETDQWTPFLFRDHTQIFPWLNKPGYNLTTDMADEAVKHLRDLNSAAPDKPFFLYYVPGGTHAPHQPTKEWIAKFKGKFDSGYEKLREEIFANQKRLGVIPPNTQLTAWPEGLPRWESLTAVQKKLYARQAEVFAAYAAYTDFEIGRVIQEVQDEGKLDNTLIIYIDGDNGTSAEGSLQGTPNVMATYNGILSLPEVVQILNYKDWGSDKTYTHMAAQWAWAFDTPFKWTKQIASHFGGTRQGLAISWPGHITDVGGIRSQFHHVIDIVPTILEATGIKAPDLVDGIKQKPIEGVSMAYTFDKANANAPSTRTTQYFELAGNRAIYHDGWMASTTPPAPPWMLGTGKLPDVVTGYSWELYNIAEDYSQNTDLAAQNPQKLEELKALFLSEAKKYNVFPLDNRAFARIVTPRPSTVAGKTEFTYSGEVSGIPPGNAPSILDRDYTITADLVIPRDGAEGMIVTMGGRFGGYGLYLCKSFNWWHRETLLKAASLLVFVVGLLLAWRGRSKKWSPRGMRVAYTLMAVPVVLVLAMFATSALGIGKGRPVFVYNLFDLKRYLWQGSAISPGKHTLVFDFKYDGPGPGKGGTGVLSVDGKTLASKTIPHTMPLVVTFFETFDVGVDTRTPVDESYELPFRFTGKIDKLSIKVGPSQLSEEEKATAAETIQKDSD
jgi:arylsulfatase A-like enzyme